MELYYKIINEYNSLREKGMSDSDIVKNYQIYIDNNEISKKEILMLIA